jgi:hypothetical protein
MLITLAMSFRADAAISEGGKSTNAAIAEEHRIIQFNQAQQSYQEMLKVGRERYNQKQINRAKIIAGMSSELRGRQETVMFHPAAPVPDSNTSGQEGDREGSTPMKLVLLAASVAALRHYRNRRREEVALADRRARRLNLNPKAVAMAEAKKKAPPVQEPDPIFLCATSGANGRGMHSPEGFLLLKGSIGFKEQGAATADKSKEPIHAALLDAGVIRQEGDAIIFEKDHLFHSPSKAATALLGRAANGWLEWKTEDGTTLDTVARRQPIEQPPSPASQSEAPAEKLTPRF